MAMCSTLITASVFPIVIYWIYNVTVDFLFCIVVQVAYFSAARELF